MSTNQKQSTLDRQPAESVIEVARRAKTAARKMARLSTEDKDRALQAIARRLAEDQDRILAANRLDLELARPHVEAGRMSEALYHRLELNQTKLAGIINGVNEVRALEDPVGKATLATELDEGLELYRVNCPIGVVGVIFESRPDALVQISSLAIKSGNAVLLKGGSEAENSNRALFSCIRDAATESGIPAGALALLESRSDVEALLGADEFVDLIIPRGSNALVRHIQDNTNIPVLGHAEGICHIYVDRAADLDKALEITIDAKTSYPAVCNAVETVLIHRDVASDFLPRLVDALREKSVEVRCDARAIEDLGLSGVSRASDEDWRTEYCDLILSILVVDSLDQAIDHINTYGSRHTDAIITEDHAAFEQFFAEVDSAGVYLNASTRFADGYRYGFGAEVGISTGKLHPRGPVGLEGLVTYKYKLLGKGHTVTAYTGAGSRKLRHRPL
jgi:glutamate-5-semialdehyde dehydrogenase